MDRLAKRLVHAGVHEHVERREVRGERLTREETGEHRAGQQALQVGALRTVADDHEADARIVREHGEIFHALFVREAADVSDDHATVDVPLLPQLRAATRRREQVAVDAAAPQRHAVDTVRFEVVFRGARRREGERRLVVDAPHPLPHEITRRCETVVGEESGHVGLVHRHRRHAELTAHATGVGAEAERCREVHDVRAELSERLAQAGAGHTELEVSVTRHGDAAGTHHAEPAVALGALARGDDHGLVVGGLQVLEQTHDRVGHAVHARQETFGDDANSHSSTVGSALCRSLNAEHKQGELPQSVNVQREFTSTCSGCTRYAPL